MSSAPLWMAGSPSENLVTLQVEQVLEATSATAIGENQVVLSANLQSDAYYVDALKNIPVGSQIVLTATSANSGWDDVGMRWCAVFPW